MSFFECCHQCPSTKRHPGCHSKCPDYIERRRLWDEHKEAQLQQRHKEFSALPIKKFKKHKNRY